MGVALVKVSPSQVQLARLCMRKWAFAYIQGLREPETRALALGTKVHSIHEAYLKHGVVPDPDECWTWPGDGDKPRTFYPGKIALSMMPAGIYPAPGVGHVEGRFNFEQDGVVWNGMLDWYTHNPDAPAAEFADMPGHAERGLVVVIDHKTSSDPEKWGKTDDTLREDAQAIVYARAMLEEFPNSNVVLHWNYGSTDGSENKARVATARFVPGEVYAKFANEIQPIGRELRRLRIMKADPLSLTPNPDACFAYYKQCPHFDKCKLTTKDRLGALMSGNTLLDNLLKEAPAGPVGAPAVPAAAPAVPLVPMAAVPAAPAAPVAPPVAPVVPAVPVAAAVPVAPVAPVIPAAAVGDVVNPPEAHSAPATAPPTSIGAPAVFAEHSVPDATLDAMASVIADKIIEKLVAKLLS